MNKRITIGIAVFLMLALCGTPAVGQDNDAQPFTPADPVETAPETTDTEAPAADPDQAEAENGVAPDREGREPRGFLGLGGWELPVILLGVLVLMYVWMGRNRKKQEQKRKDMLSQLSKGDKIMSIGGILGTVIEAKPDELVVKVDEANNIRMRFARWAVRAVGDEAQSDASKDQPQG